MKQVSILVEVSFNDSIEKGQIDEVAKNIMEALVSQVNTAGLAPEESETFTKAIQLSESGLYLLREEF